MEAVRCCWCSSAAVTICNLAVEEAWVVIESVHTCLDGRAEHVLGGSDCSVDAGMDKQ